MAAAYELRARVEDAWHALRTAVALADLETPTAAGWTGKEMLAHVAFWLETVPPFVAGAFRHDPAAFEVTFPSGFVAGQGAWPDADTHNAREAAWARTQPATAVMQRADAAYEALRAFLGSVTDDEVTAQAAYFAGLHRHLDEHRAGELAG